MAGFTALMAHEAGHIWGFNDCSGCSNTTMNTPVTSTSPTSPTSCDQQAAYNFSNGAYGTPPPSGGGGGTGGGSGGGDFECFIDGAQICRNCGACSPIIVDMDGNDFQLTSFGGGVRFDLNRDGRAGQIAWTSAVSDDAFLALDRNGNGRIDDGGELFGNFTDQPASSSPNGFLALAELDKPVNGGNGNGVIDPGDVVYWSLRLWQDKNHDGISDPAELLSLSWAGIASIALDYRRSERQDRFGNLLRYRAKVTKADGSSRWAYDVFFVIDDFRTAVLRPECRANQSKVDQMH
ncbi:MAG TPA: hypothetical protein VLA96_03905 [Terriglobales bacterium]|nr:hypothetical protein [Terriglobales bacterium]